MELFCLEEAKSLTYPYKHGANNEMGPKVHGGYLDQIDQRLNGKLLLMGGLLMCFFC